MTWFFGFNLMATGEEAEACDPMVVGTYHVVSLKDRAPKTNVTCIYSQQGQVGLISANLKSVVWATSTLAWVI